MQKAKIGSHILHDLFVVKLNAVPPLHLFLFVAIHKKVYISPAYDVMVYD